MTSRVTSAGTGRTLMVGGVSLAFLLASAIPAAAQEAPLTRQVSTSVRSAFSRLVASLERTLPAIAAGLVVLAVFWGLATVVRQLVRAATSHFPDPTVRDLVVRVSYYAIWAVGLIVSLDAVGLDPQAVVTGLGLTGVALGFALKDILSNLVSGVLIMAMRSFEIGDQIVLGSTEGTVEEIELRSTHIRTYDGRLVMVPNGEVFTSRLTNNTESPVRRASVFIFLDYREDLPRALAAVLDTVKLLPGVAANPPPSMRLHDLTPEHLQLEARFWTDSKRTDFMNTASAARIAIVARLKSEGIALPDPDERRGMLTKVSPQDRPNQ